MTIIEKILASHSKNDLVRPGQIVDISIDTRVARDFGGANVVKHLKDHELAIDDPAKTLFTFDCNPTGSDQKYAVNQHICRLFARDNDILVYDIDAGIGTHILIDKGYVGPGATAISTDSHANILGAVGAFGQGMGDMDIAAAWHKGRVWFKVPPSVRIDCRGALNDNVSAKDFILNLLKIFGASSLLGCSIELYGDCIDRMTLDERITISSMATEMGAIIILFPPSGEVTDYCRRQSKTDIIPVFADDDAYYERRIELDVNDFVPMISMPGEPHDTVEVASITGTPIDSAFIGSCTNGRMSDMYSVAKVLKGRKVAPGVVMKIVPSTDEIWKKCLAEGLLQVFKDAGALVSNAGCAGCAAGQVGQNGPGEVTISTGNRNFPGKQGKGRVYLASPEIVAASSVTGFITTPGNNLAKPVVVVRNVKHSSPGRPSAAKVENIQRPRVIEGRVHIIKKDNIDTDMIFHNRYLAVTDINEMGQYTFDNLKGYTDFAKSAGRGDIVVAGKNFGNGSSRQQAVDCFVSLGISGIIAESFGAIYERNAINAAFPVITCKTINELCLNDGDVVRINLLSGEITNMTTGKISAGEPFSEVQYGIYQKGGLLAL